MKEINNLEEEINATYFIKNGRGYIEINNEKYYVYSLLQLYYKGLVQHQLVFKNINCAEITKEEYFKNVGKRKKYEDDLWGDFNYIKFSTIIGIGFILSRILLMLHGRFYELPELYPLFFLLLVICVGFIICYKNRVRNANLKISFISSYAYDNACSIMNFNEKIMRSSIFMITIDLCAFFMLYFFYFYISNFIMFFLFMLSWFFVCIIAFVPLNLPKTKAIEILEFPHEKK